MQLTAQRIPLPAAGEKSSETANALKTLQKRGESHHVGVMFAIYSIEFLRVDIIKATDVECQQKNVWLFVHVLNVLCWPVIASFLDVQPSQNLLDIACGNGLTSRRLAGLGANVTAFDFSAELIKRAGSRPNPDSRITYHVMDGTDESALRALGEGAFDSALCNMALFDMADIEPLFRALPRLLKPKGAFVFSLTHPAFNNASTVHVVEEVDYEGEIKTVYSVKASRYMTSYHARGLALRNQPQPQMYFERPLQYYLNLGFQNGFVLDAFAERAFPPEHPQDSPLGWGGKFSEIPPALVARLRLSSS